MLQNRLVSVQRVSEQNRVAVYRMNRKMDVASNDKINFESRLQELEDHISTLEATVKNLNGSLDIAKTERDELAEHITELESPKVKTKQHSQLYLDGVRQCCIELMSFNVSMKHVEPVIRSVLHHLVNLEVDKLPKPVTLVEMVAQMKGLACQQLAEKENLTQVMMIYGLWQTDEQMKEGLAQLKSKTSKLQALKAQLDFRKVLELIRVSFAFQRTEKSYL